MVTASPSSLFYKEVPRGIRIDNHKWPEYRSDHERFPPGKFCGLQDGKARDGIGEHAQIRSDNRRHFSYGQKEGLARYRDDPSSRASPSTAGTGKWQGSHSSGTLRCLQANRRIHSHDSERGQGKPVE